MSDLVICRICLRADVKSYHYEQYNLKYYYEQITACKVNEREHLPKWFCFECAAHLLKYYRFRQRCYTGQNTLRDIAWNGMLSYEAISKIDRDGRNLQSPLSITNSDEGNVTNILSPSVPYKKRNNIKIVYVSNDDQVTNTYDQPSNVNSASTSGTEAIVLENVEDNMTDESKSDDIKSEITSADMEMMNPTNAAVRLEPLNICTNTPVTVTTYQTAFIESSGYHPEPAIYSQNEAQDGEPVWIPDISESLDNEEKKQQQWATKSSVLDPANWKRTMLSEEEALAKFHKRAIDPKFVNARYKCMDCYSNFAREEMLRKHILINHVETLGPHMCRFCKRRFHKACKLRLHMKRHYVQIQCLRCNMLFWGEGLAFQHEEFHRGVTTTCQYCNHQFRHKSTYYQHLRTHHRSAHVCSLCGASFVSKAGLNVHKKRLHALDNKETYKEPDANIYCKRCDMKFATLAAYQEHYRHSALHADGMDIGEDVRGAGNSTRQPYVRCTECNEQFFTYQACMKHHRHQHPAVPFMNKSVAYSGKSSERVNCEICGALIKVTSLYTHMNAHTRTKVYTCEICEMQFNYPTSLLRHKVTHTGEKKYPCPLCEKRFTQRNSMQLHYRTFHLKEPYPKRNRQKKKPAAAPEPTTMML